MVPFLFLSSLGLAEDIEDNVSGKTRSVCYTKVFKKPVFTVMSATLVSSTVHSAFSVGKVQISIHKQVKEKWTSLGQPLDSHNTFLLKKDRSKIPN